ncbi:FKBP-type peptidyl-prolyl cis-trans isomerase [Allokutzneria oryzae]|uniref:Peptidyl-prolyl cis-trans isomerase n=1 Tax=Allokutzneria oryzae TaxID=1378989 RepID=A0ABV5ZYT6_9PSEU
MRKTAAMTAILISTVLAVTGCTPSERPSDLPDGGASAGQTTAAQQRTTTAAAVTTASGPACTADQVTVAGAANQKPTITIPANCAPPTELLSKDLTPGTGAAIKAGDPVQMNYLLVTWSDKKEVDTSFGTNPFSLTVGAGEVIKGWDEGLVGLKQGGRRLLVIPPAKGYGPNGSSPIKGNETLVFVVDAVKVGA